MMSKVDEVFRKVLNDRDIFWNKKEIFSKTEWRELQEKRNNEPDQFKEKIDNKIQVFKNERNKTTRDKKEDIEASIQQCNRLLINFKEKSNLLDQMFNYLDAYSLVKCNLPGNMDDYGKVIERYGISTVEHFFLDKIKRENDQYKKKALEKVLEYTKELYRAHQSILEIAYFVRKLDSLKIFWEV